MNLVPDIQKYLETYEGERLDELKRECIILRRVLGYCESPLEQKFLIALIRNSRASVSLCSPDCPTDELEEMLKSHKSISYSAKVDAYSDQLKFWVIITPQVQIELLGKTYRVDFLLTLRGELSRHSRLSQGEREKFDREYLRVVVEIDGHNYHERTKEQALRDKSRDRIMLKKGYIVFRYTGSEVHSSAEKLTSELMRFLFQKAIKFARDSGF